MDHAVDILIIVIKQANKDYLDIDSVLFHYYKHNVFLPEKYCLNQTIPDRKAFSLLSPLV